MSETRVSAWEPVRVPARIDDRFDVFSIAHATIETRMWTRQIGNRWEQRREWRYADGEHILLEQWIRARPGHLRSSVPACTARVPVFA